MMESPSILDVNHVAESSGQLRLTSRDDGYLCIVGIRIVYSCDVG